MYVLVWLLGLWLLLCVCVPDCGAVLGGGGGGGTSSSAAIIMAVNGSTSTDRSRACGVEGSMLASASPSRGAGVSKCVCPCIKSYTTHTA